MTTQQPEALRLAEILEGGYSLAWLYERGGYEVSAELRRQHALIAELESQLAQRFDAADMATAAAQGFRDGVASVSAHPADSVQEDAARLDFLIDQGAYVVSDPDTCTGYWLRWAMPDGRTRWCKLTSTRHPAPQLTQAASKEPDGSLPCGH